MKFIFAPDSFKGSLSALRITELLTGAAQQVFPGAACIGVPVADGGEGTVDALLAALGGEKHTLTVTGPDARQVSACYGVTADGTAVLEMASASGLPLMAEKDPLRATSRGSGEMLAHVLRRGAKRVLMGIGGSATNDGGAGFLTALGARFTDENGCAIPEGGAGLERIAHADLSGLMGEARTAQITVICDVTNPLLGERGATAVYGPQKGVTPAMMPRLEGGMARYASVLQNTLGREMNDVPGYGAAGGMGMALGGVLGAKLMRGIDAVLDAARFDELLSGADLVVTGEGRMDEQSVRYGKVACGVAARADRAGVPVIALVGSMGPGAEAFLEEPGHSIMTTVNGVMPLETAMADAERLCREAAVRLFRMIRMGVK